MRRTLKIYQKARQIQMSPKVEEEGTKGGKIGTVEDPFVARLTPKIQETLKKAIDQRQYLVEQFKWSGNNHLAGLNNRPHEPRWGN